MRLMLMLVIICLLVPVSVYAEATTTEAPVVASVNKEYPLRTDITQIVGMKHFQLVTDDLLCQSVGAEYRLSWEGNIVINGTHLPMVMDYLFRDGLIVADQSCIQLPDKLEQAEEYVDVIQTLVTMNFGKTASTVVDQLATPDWYREVRLANENGDKMMIRWRGTSLLIILLAGSVPDQESSPGLLLPH